MSKTFRFKKDDTLIETSGYTADEVIAIFKATQGAEIKLPVQFEFPTEKDSAYGKIALLSDTGKTLATIDEEVPPLGLSRDDIRIPNNYDELGRDLPNNIITTGISCPYCKQSFAFFNDNVNYVYVRGYWYIASNDKVSAEVLMTKKDKVEHLKEIYNDLENIIDETDVYVKLGKEITLQDDENLTCMYCGAKHTFREQVTEHKMLELAGEGHCIICSSNLTSEEYDNHKCNYCNSKIDWVLEG